MTSADAIPVAAPQETQKPPESPDFMAQIERLEGMAAAGLETPYGPESVQFRVGIEVEFAILDPKNFRDVITAELAAAETRHNNLVTEKPDQAETLQKNYDERQAKAVKTAHDRILNRHQIDGEQVDTTELVEDFRHHASDFVERLPAQSDSEEAKRRVWLDQIPSFGAREMINFLLYEEFSSPNLADIKAPVGATLDQLDDYAEQHGWLEFRFGKGTLQTGYYDNEGMCEIRQTPCPPSEALRRKQVIRDRMIELADQFGLLIQSDAQSEHINLSVYAQPVGQDQYQPLIKQNDPDHARTLDVTAGISKAYADGLWLNPANVPHEYWHGRGANGTTLEVGPGRRSLRVMDDVMELRAKFNDSAQAVDWLLAGSIVGLQEGAQSIEEQGYTIPHDTTTHRVHRQPDFDKAEDLHIQRAFEMCDFSTGKFVLNGGFNAHRGTEATQALVGDKSLPVGSSTFNSVVFASVQLGEDGIPQVTAERLQAEYDGVKESFKPSFGNIMGYDFAEIADRVNQNLRQVSLEPVVVVAGRGEYVVEDKQAAIDRLKTSSVAQLALGSELEAHSRWLQAAIPPQVAA